MNDTGKYAPKKAIIFGLLALASILLAGCTDQIEGLDFNNPLDPQNPNSPLAASVIITSPIIGGTYDLTDNPSSTLSLTWEPVGGATRYEYVFATTPDPESFPEQVIGHGETQNTQAGPFFVDSAIGTYYFGVRYQAVVPLPEGDANYYGPWYTGWCSVEGTSDGGDGTSAWTIGPWTSLISLPSVHGITLFDGGNFWMVDQSISGIVEIDGTGTLVNTVSHPGTNPTGLANDGTDLYVADDVEKAIYRVATDGSSSNLLISGFGDATGLTYAWDRGSLFLASFEDGGTIFEIRISDGSIIQSFPAPSGGAEGLTYDTPYLWHVDLYTNILYLIDPDSHEIWEVAQLSGDQSSPIGLAFDKTTDDLFLVSLGTGILSVAPIYRSGDPSGGVGIVDGITFPAGASTVVEFSVPDSVFGGLGDWDFEPIIYRADNNAELDFTGALFDDLSALPMTPSPIAPDGDLSDWGGITPYGTDPSGDELEVRTGSDLIALYLAQQSDGSLAVAFELADNAPNVGNLYAFHMDNIPSFGMGSPGFYVSHDGSGWTGISVGY